MKKLRYNKRIFPLICFIRQLYLTTYGNIGKSCNNCLLIAVKLLLLPIFAPCYLICGLIKVKTQLAKDAKTNFKYQLTLVGIVKNEASYIREWIEYYRLIGVDHFVIYDNGSTDDTTKEINIVNSFRGGGRTN